MKRKILSITICLMFCLSSIFVFGACGKEKAKEVSEVVAMDAFNKASVNMEDEEVVKMTCDIPFGGKMTYIFSQNKTYINVPDESEMWMIKNGDVYDQYLIENVGIEEIEYEYIKSIVPAVEDVDKTSFENVFNNGGMGEDLLGDLVSLKFLNASELNGELTINFSLMIDESPLFTYSFKIKDNVFIGMKINVFGVIMNYAIEYGEQYLEEIPEVPNYEWDEYDPYIEVLINGNVPTEPIEFEVGDQLNLSDFDLRFYQDEFVFNYEDFDVTIDMIEGFNTQTPTEEGQPRKMKVTFCGLIYEIEYIVTQPTVE